jgi:hypothetical protein
MEKSNFDFFLEGIVENSYKEEAYEVAEKYDNIIKENSNSKIVLSDIEKNKLIEYTNNLMSKIKYIEDNTFLTESSFVSKLFNSFQERIKQSIIDIPNDKKESCLLELYSEINSVEKANTFIHSLEKGIIAYSSEEFKDLHLAVALNESKKILEKYIMKAKLLLITLKSSLNESHDKHVVLNEGIVTDIVRTVSFKRWRNISKMNKNDYSGFMDDLEEDLEDIDTLKDKERFLIKIKSEIDDGNKIISTPSFSKLVLAEHRIAFINYINFLKRLHGKASIKKVDK